MKIQPTKIPEVLQIDPQLFSDERGSFMETWHQRKFADSGLEIDFVQDNQSTSSRHALRGLHYQIRQPQGKLARVVAGEAFDVAVDLRRGSATFGQWAGVRLSGDNRRMIWIPPGFAHGFYVLSDSVTFLYKCTDFYAPEHERTIRWDDPDLAIDWPLVDGEPPFLSRKDLEGTSFRDAELYP